MAEGTEGTAAKGAEATAAAGTEGTAATVGTAATRATEGAAATRAAEGAGGEATVVASRPGAKSRKRLMPPPVRSSVHGCRA